MFPDTAGGYLSKSNFRERHYLPTLARAGVPKVRFHDLRHCCASLLWRPGWTRRW